LLTFAKEVVLEFAESGRNDSQKKWNLVIVHPDKLARMMLRRLVPIAEIEPCAVSRLNDVFPLAIRGQVDVVLLTESAYREASIAAVDAFREEYPNIQVMSPADDNLARFVGASSHIWSWVRAKMNHRVKV